MINHISHDAGMCNNTVIATGLAIDLMRGSSL